MPGVKKGTASPKDDRRVVEGALGSKDAELQDVRLGPIEFAVWDELCSCYDEKGAPLTPDECAAVVLKHANTGNAFVMLNGLEKKGVLQSDERSAQNRHRVPRTRGIRILVGRGASPKQMWPTAEPKPRGIRSKKDKPSTRGKLFSATRMSEQGPLVCTDPSVVVHMNDRRAKVYEAFMDLSRSNGYAPLTAKQMHAVIREHGEDPGLLYVFDHQVGVILQVKETAPGVGVDREVVFVRYRVRGEAKDRTPPECGSSHEPVIDSASAAARPVLRTKADLIQELASSVSAMERRRAHIEAERLAAHAMLEREADDQIERLREQLQIAQQQREELARQRERLSEQPLAADAELERLGREATELQVAIDNYDAVMKFAARP